MSTPTSPSNRSALDERLDPQRLADHVWGFRWGIAILSVSVGLVALGFRLAAQGMYRASAQVLVLSPVAETELAPRYELSMQSYMELARGEGLVRRALNACAGRLSERSARPGAVRLDVDPVRDTRVLVLSALAPGAQDAAEVANEAARQFLELLREVRSQEILDKRRLVGMDLEALEGRMVEQKKRLDALLEATGQWTEAEIRAELGRLRRLRSDPPAGGAADAAGAAAGALGQLDAQIAALEGRLQKDRENLGAISLESWKLEQLQGAYASLSHRSQTLGTEINERLGHAVLSSEAQVPLLPLGASPLNFAVLGAAVTATLTVSLLLLWALLTGQHLLQAGGAARA